MRGLPGSGKTTKARHVRANLEKLGYTCQICSTDDFWVRKGKYDFNLSLLHYAHKWNEARATYFMYQGIDIVIIDATNVDVSSVATYKALAMTFGYGIRIEEPDTPWARNPEECHKRCEHGCSLETIVRMNERYKYMERE